jgi:hypothetical protein
MFEHRKHALLPWPKFLGRMARMLTIACGVVAVSLGIGVAGYRLTEQLLWIDALLNAAMILFGMGPVNTPQSTAGKLFATFYAMFAGVAFLTVAAVLFAPLFHRMIHRFHLELDEEQDERPPSSSAAP